MSDPIRSISQNNYLLSNGGGGHEYSGANGVYVDNVNEVIGLDTSASNAIETVIENSGAWGGAGLPISAGPGVKISLVSGTLVVESDETVLFDANSPSGASACHCSESIMNFERVGILPSRFLTSDGGGTGPYQYYETKWLKPGNGTLFTLRPMIYEYDFWKIAIYSGNSEMTDFVWYQGFESQQSNHTYRAATSCNVGIDKIVGIGRKSN